MHCSFELYLLQSVLDLCDGRDYSVVEDEVVSSSSYTYTSTLVLGHVSQTDTVVYIMLYVFTLVLRAVLR